MSAPEPTANTEPLQLAGADVGIPEPTEIDVPPVPTRLEIEGLVVEAFASGLTNTLMPTIQSLDSSVLQARECQVRLLTQVDRLSGELHRFVNQSSTPILDKHVARLLSLKKRIEAVNRSLAGTRQVVDRMMAQVNAPQRP
ncbi:hypothetical protein H696_05478 [Fonticula alba]|uniref:Biogenesis of lysosome-related organelles complex 1 subunit 7 n=1 Tax=Fonticula alba TaxID=691883 RepID=A0A058Z177_FONAL|nr:hypothetical protein H696_05478 [Fonticula alba]KCV68009.1 hypothetical protein H696_05478 [Fonticula alba]|eukprot:XP_009497576.1 hypothetical protein H696_05478 [Fonticula alba]